VDEAEKKAERRMRAAAPGFAYLVVARHRYWLGLRPFLGLWKRDSLEMDACGCPPGQLSMET
jgi:hypothetical protein